MFKHEELICHKPPRLPPLLEMPYIMTQFRAGVLDRYCDRDRIFAALGGVPHPGVIAMWLAWLIGRPKSEFSGGPIWYQWSGAASCRVNDVVSDALGRDVGRRLIEPGEKIAVHSWTLEGREDFVRCDNPLGPVLPSWPELRAKPFRKALELLEPHGIEGGSWRGLEKSYRDHEAG